MTSETSPQITKMVRAVALVARPAMRGILTVSWVPLLWLVRASLNSRCYSSFAPHLRSARWARVLQMIRFDPERQ